MSTTRETWITALCCVGLIGAACQDANSGEQWEEDEDTQTGMTDCDDAGCLGADDPSAMLSEECRLGDSILTYYPTDDYKWGLEGLLFISNTYNIYEGSACSPSECAYNHRYELLMMDNAGAVTHVADLPATGFDVLDISADGSTYAEQSGSGIAVKNLQGETLSTFRDIQTVQTSSKTLYLSPNGSLAVVDTPDSRAWSLFDTAVDGATGREIIGDNVFGVRSIAWSPDGSKIAYTLLRSRVISEQKSESVYVMGIKAVDETLFTETFLEATSPFYLQENLDTEALDDYDRDPEHLIWAADGEGVRYSINDTYYYLQATHGAEPEASEVESSDAISPDGTRLIGTHCLDFVSPFSYCDPVLRMLDSSIMAPIKDLASAPSQCGVSNC